MLTIPSEILQAMVEHCRNDAPLEACGLLGGADSLVSLFYPLRNADASATTYLADPHDLLTAVRDLRAREAEILAIYHSHPRSSPLPSRTDLRTNYYGDVPRIIVSLLSEPPEIRVWRLDPEAYHPLPWQIES